LNTLFYLQDCLYRCM